MPVVGMSLVPAFLAVPLIGPVVGIGSHLAPLPQALSGALTDCPAAIALILHTRIWRKHTPAMGAANLAVHGSLLKEPEPIRTALPGKYKNQIQRRWLKEVLRKYIQVG
jgi:hypothetical protein